MAISVENRKFSPPVYFTNPLREVPWNFVTAIALRKTRVERWKEYVLTPENVTFFQWDGQATRRTDRIFTARCYA